MSNEKMESIMNTKILDYLSENQVKYNIGDMVYLKTDTDQRIRIVNAVIFEENGVNYRIVCGTEHYWASAIELSVEKDLVIKINE